MRASPIVKALGTLLQQLADEREDEERKHRAPQERVDDHQHPPEDAAGSRAKCIRHGISRLPKECRILEHEEADEVNDAQRHVREQKRFHC